MISTILHRSSRVRQRSQSHLKLQRRLTIEVLDDRVLLSITPSSLLNPLTEGGLGVQTAGPAQHQTLADLSATAQQAISSQIGKELTASDGATNDEFGFSVAVSGDTVVVGAPYAEVGANQFQGAAYIFTKPGAGWADMTETAKLTASDGQANDEFGYSVAISGNTVVVAAEFATVGTSAQGAAYVFTEPSSGWADMTQTAKLTASDGAAGDGFGCSVSISGNTAVVGADTAHGVNGPQGAAYVFDQPHSGWTNMTQTAKLTASDGQANDEFGCSVLISGSTAVVGAFAATVGINSHQGAAYVFTQPSSGWTNMTQTAKLTASDGQANDEFGCSVAVSGNAAVVGAAYATVGANDYQGAAYVFTEHGSHWANMTQTAKLTASDGQADDEFGTSVAISGDTVVVGEEMAQIGANDFQGAAYVFTMPNSGWTNMTETAKLTAPDGQADDFSAARSP